MFTTMKQLERYERSQARRERYSLYLGLIEVAVFITVFYVVCEVAYNLSSLI